MKRSLALLMLLGILSAVANAATVTVIYVSNVSVTPLPGTMLLVGIGLAFAYFVFRKVNRLPAGHGLAAILLLVGLSLTEVATRQQLIEKASAITVSFAAVITNAGPLSISNVFDGGEGTVTNNLGTPQRITNIAVDSGFSIVTPVNSPQCVVGTVLNPSQFCYIKVVNPQLQ